MSDELNDLDFLAAQSERLERERDAEYEAELVGDGGESGGEPVEFDQKEASENLTETVLACGLGVARLFVDHRLDLPQEEVEQARVCVGPALAKYGIPSRGAGRLPYQEEVTAGLYLGGLIKRTIRAVRELRAADKKMKNGEKREHEITESAQSVPSEKRAGEKPNAFEAEWNPTQRG